MLTCTIRRVIGPVKSLLSPFLERSDVARAWHDKPALHSCNLPNELISCMSLFIRLFLFCSLLPVLVSAQPAPQPGRIDPARVTIARDSYGVPHIFAKTDSEVAYGLAWAHAEDNFETIQQLVLPAKGMLGRHLGKEGAAVDYVVELLHAPEIVAAAGDTALSPDFRAVVLGYLQGLNDYAAAHPGEVLVRGTFPVTLAEYLKVSVLSLSVISGVERALQGIFAGKVPTVDLGEKGSNAFAIHRSKTTDGQTMLAINSHQPLEGPVAWYEAHLCSEQGWNALGSLFPGGATIFHGVNEHLGWAHTVNYQDKIDIFQLQTDKNHPDKYRFDGQWIALDQKRVRLRIKGIPFAIGKKAYWSKYGATVKTKQGWFSLRTGANQDLRGLEQWYRMNKARSFTEFRGALAMTAIPGFNIVYADPDTIYYVSNGKIPFRNPAYDWSGTVPGNTSKTLWTTFHPLSDFPQYLNPPGGYLFNMNNTPFNATAPADNLRPEVFDKTMGYERWNTNRSLRFAELIGRYDKLTYADVKRIKYDQQLPARLEFPQGPDVNLLFSLNASAYPDIRPTIDTLNAWNRQATANSHGAALFANFYYYWRDKLAGQDVTKKVLTADECAEGLRHAQRHFQTYFGKTSVALGEYQKHARGDKAVPIWGIPDVLTAITSGPFKDGRIHAGRIHSTNGESYISLVRFPGVGLPIIETINCFGASNRPNSPHYTDQMDLFVQQKTKPMTLNKADVLRTAKRVYHPGE